MSCHDSGLRQLNTELRTEPFWACTIRFPFFGYRKESRGRDLMELMNGQIHSFIQALSSWQHFRFSFFQFLFLIKHYSGNLALYMNKDSDEDFITYVPFDNPKSALTFLPK